MKQRETFFWYDLETFGLDSRSDRVAQFAGIRTDKDLKEIDEPVVLYCRLSDDYLPDPLACLITYITPDVVAEKGVNESEFFGQINAILSQPYTCAVGYNSLRFDDEFIRNGFFRNFIDPYKREYANGNSRWDILDLVRAAHDLRPEGIVWPIKEETGNPSFKLTDLTQANAIAHTHAHDALSDVRATIEVARLIKRHQPLLFTYYLTLRSKQKVKSFVNVMGEPVLLTAAPFTRSEGCSTLVMPLSGHSKNPNSVLVFDLRQDPTPLINAAKAFNEVEQLELMEDDFRKTAQQLKRASESSLGVEQALREGTRQLLEGANLLSNLPRLIDGSSQLLQVKGLHRVAINRVPFFSPLSVIDDEVAKRLNLDVGKCMEHYERLKAVPTVALNLRKALDKEEFLSIDDVDYSLYSGAFFSDADAQRFAEIRATDPQELWAKRFNFDDPRSYELLWRYQCRNWPEVLSDAERLRYKSFCALRLIQPPASDAVTLDFFARKIREKMASNSTKAEDKEVLAALEKWGRALCERIGLKYPTPRQ